MFFARLRTLFRTMLPEARRRPRPRTRLRLEHLEDRLVPSGFAVQGDQLLVTGTTGPDVFTFTAADQPVVTLNDESYAVDPDTIHSIRFDGLGGGDQATLIDATDFASELALRPNSATLTGANYSLQVDNVETIVAVGSANGTASLFGSASGMNTFTGTSAYAILSGP